MSMLGRRTLLVAAASAAVLTTGAAGIAQAAPAEKTVTLNGFDAPGPAKYDKVKVVQTGPSSAKNVLVLVPGTSAGAGYFLPLARTLATELKGWQIWSVERRENLLEDQTGLDRFKRGEIDVDTFFNYYLGWIGSPAAPAQHFTPPTDASVGFAREWGMNVAVEDLKRVVTSAKKGGRKVVMAGHSLGGSITAAYATWDFKGRAGVKDLDGLVMIDGGSGPGTKERPTYTPAMAEEALGKLATESPFLDLTGLKLPWSAGVFNAVGSTLALKAPNAPARLGAWPLLPANLKPPVAATNRGGYGFALDTETGPESLALVQMHLGHLASSGDPRGWEDGELVSLDRAATAFSGPVGMDGTAWYHPRRLTLDASVVNGGVKNPGQKTLGVKATHAKDVDVPIYAIATSLGGERVLKGARLLAQHGTTKAKDVKLVDRHATEAHLDPIAADPDKSTFIKTVVPFLEKAVR
jgi:pimeloyl-ACP methyl ester carboxylesterase